MYKAVIGLEIHVELNTESKMFSPSKNEYDKTCNNNVTEIDLAFPGTMPSVNKEALNKAISLCLALNSNISDYLMFDRKNYYYPDLPKGFQITQMTKPLGKGGFLEINVNGYNKRILIHQIHIEEDAASFDHKGEYSVINYNRVGVPLVEIVTEPCMSTPEEAIEFLESLKSIIEYLNISEANQTKGQIRCDVNVSLMKDTDTELGVRIEVKNTNSFNIAKETMIYEIKRQTELLNSGEKIVRETRRYSDIDGKTYSMRDKAEAIDYKYYVEPNIPVFKISDELIEEIKNKLPILPNERKNNYVSNYGLAELEAKNLVRDKNISDLFEKTISFGSNPKEASNWISMKLIGYLNKNSLELSDINISAENLNELISLINSNKISFEQGKKVFDIMLLENKKPIDIVNQFGIEQVSDESQIIEIISKVLDESNDAVISYKSGKTNIIGFLMGKVLKESGGKINPGIANKLLIEEINKR